MTDSPRSPRETPAQYAERHRRAANDGRHDRVAELQADLEATYQRAIWSLTVGQALMLSGVLADETDINAGVIPSGDHRPRMVALRRVG